MPALVKRRFGLSGMRLEEGTIVCCFDLKKSRNDWRISLLVIVIAPARRSAGDGENTLGNDEMPNVKENSGPRIRMPRVGEKSYTEDAEEEHRGHREEYVTKQWAFRRATASEVIGRPSKEFDTASPSF
jgi:hypothetical protein